MARTFQELGLEEDICTSVGQHLNVHRPTPIQSSAIPTLLSGSDAFIQSETGTGKTLAYLMPLLQYLHKIKDEDFRVSHSDSEDSSKSTDDESQDVSTDRCQETLGLIIAPTRELVMQTYQIVAKVLLKSRAWRRFVPGYLMGGEKKKSEKARIRKGISVLVATPGRLLDHLRTTKSLHVSRLRFLIFDEGDQLIDHGFLDPIKQILQLLNSTEKVNSNSPEKRQTIVVSATLKSKVKDLASLCCHAPVFVLPASSDSNSNSAINSDTTLLTSSSFAVPQQLKQYYFMCTGSYRLVSLFSLLQLRCLEANRKGKSLKMIVFFSSCASVDFHFHLFTKFQRETLYDEYVVHKEATPSKARRHFQNDVGSAANNEEDEFAFLFNDANTTKSNKKKKKEMKNTVSHNSKNTDSALSEDVVSGKMQISDENNIALTHLTLLRLHGDLPQKSRQDIFFQLNREKSKGTHTVLFCTDVASRGLDVSMVDMIIHYDVPQSIADYIHRTGRTGRMGEKGESLLFLLPSEGQYIKELSQTSNVLVEYSLEQVFGRENLKSNAELNKITPPVDRASHATTNNAKEGEENDEEEKTMQIFRWTNVFRREVKTLQSLFEFALTKNTKLKEISRDAFLAYVRGYATHKEKAVFHVKSLHLGHIAKSFALTDAPKKMGDVFKHHEKMKKSTMSKKSLNDFQLKKNNRKRGISGEFDNRVQMNAKKRKIKLRV